MKTYLVCISLAAIVLAGSAIGQTEETANNAKTNAFRKPPRITMKKDQTQGRVFFLGDNQNDEQPASNLTVRIETAEDRKVLFETASDGNGRFTIAPMDAGRYRLMVGQLLLDLQVREADPLPAGAKHVPKVLLVILPRAMDAPGPEPKGGTK